MKANPPRHISAFEARSLVLFASLALGGAASSMAQPVREPAARSAAATPRTAAAVKAEQAAFERADRNQDGQLSATEAQSLPVIASRLTELDADGNGSLSREEFSRGAQQ
ncbi:EF hand [compost metagenome]